MSDPKLIKINKLHIQVGPKFIQILNLTGATTVKELKKRFFDQEGQDEDKEIIFICNAKQLTDDDKILADYGIKDNSALSVMFRVKGGMEGVIETPIIPIEEAEGSETQIPIKRKLTCSMNDWPNGVKPTDKPCIFSSENCPSDEKNAQMPCNEKHILSAEGMYQYIKSVIDCNGKDIIKCFDSNCEGIWDPITCYWIARLNENEEKTFSVQLNKNYINSNREMKICPFCEVFLFRKDLPQNRVQCCESKDWCWQCRQPWNNSLDNTKCGNASCNERAINLETTLNCDRATISGISNVPVVRLCPNCDSLVQWTEKCKHLTCPNKACAYEFCIVCLKEWKSVGKNDHLSDITPDKCPVHPIQDFY